MLYLGTNIPLDRLHQTIQATRPDLIVMAAQSLDAAARLLEMALLFRELELKLAYGGLIFNQIPGLRGRIPAHFLGESLEGAPEVIDRLLMTRGEMPSFEGSPEDHKEAIAAFLRSTPKIETFVWDSMAGEEITPQDLVRVNASMSQNISAALALGDLAYLDSSFEWLQTRMTDDRWTQEQLDRYLLAYSQAAERYLDQPAQAIVQWMEALSGAHSDR